MAGDIQRHLSPEDLRQRLSALILRRRGAERRSQAAYSSLD
jgi:hypothetical protein